MGYYLGKLMGGVAGEQPGYPAGRRWGCLIWSGWAGGYAGPRRMLASGALHPAGGLQRRAAWAMDYFLGKIFER